MSKPTQRSAAQLFNNPTLSDVTIKQITKGKVREYRAHKAILSADSSFFLRAFSGGFLEASQDTMEVHDDDPDHFEFLFKYIYTYHYDKAAISKLAGADSSKRIFFPIGIHAVANKYDVPCIYEAITEDLRDLLTSIEDKELKKIIEAHYKTMMTAGGPVGELLTSIVLRKERKFMHTAEYRQLVLSYTAFGADMALTLERDTIDLRCFACARNFTIRRDVLLSMPLIEAFCPYCRIFMDCQRFETKT